MTEQGFREALNRVASAFPSFASWCDKLKKENRMSGMVEAWQKQLAFSDDGDVDAVVDKIVSGEIDLPEYYDYDRTGKLIQQHATAAKKDRRLAERAKEQSRAIPESSSAAQRHGLLLVAAMRKVRSIADQLRKGRITAEQNAEQCSFVLQSLPEPPVQCQPRIKCSVCMDRGLISYKHTYTASDRTASGHPYPANVVGKTYEVVGACSCSASDVYRSEGGQCKPLPVAQVVPVEAMPNYRHEFAEYQ